MSNLVPAGIVLENPEFDAPPEETSCSTTESRDVPGPTWSGSEAGWITLWRKQRAIMLKAIKTPCKRNQMHMNAVTVGDKIRFQK